MGLHLAGQAMAKVVTVMKVAGVSGRQIHVASATSSVKGLMRVISARDRQRSLTLPPAL